jgi:hypothetical protein
MRAHFMGHLHFSRHIMRRRLFMFGAGLLLVAAPCYAQGRTWTDRGFINVNVAGQDKERTESGTFAFSLYEEDATIGTSRVVPHGTFPDVMAGWRLWKNVGLAGQFSTRNAQGDGSLAGSVPDPFAYNAPRIVNGTASALKHQETWFSVAAVYLLPITSKIHVMAFGGPTVVKLDHEIIDGATLAETSGTPTVSAQREMLSRSVWGGMVGADVRYMFTSNIGIGAFARLQSAKVNLPQGGLSIETGGPQAGAGVRIAF